MLTMVLEMTKSSLKILVKYIIEHLYHKQATTKKRDIYSIRNWFSS